MTDERPGDRTAQTDPELERADETDAGAFIGREPELTRADYPTTGEASQDTNPDPGWAKPPEGHRQATHVNDDDLKRKG